MLTEPCRRGKIGQVGSVNWPALGPTGSTVWSGAYRWSKDGLPLPWWKCDTLEAGQAREVVDDRGLVAGKDHPLALLLVLEGVHGIVVVAQQTLDPGAMQFHGTRARLFLQRRVHQRHQPLGPFAAEASLDVGQALAQPLGKGREPLLDAMQRDELGEQVDDVILEDALYPVGEAVFQPNQRIGLHAPVQRQRQRTAADDAPLVLQHEMLDAGGTLLEQVDGQAVLEIDLRRLWRGVAAEAGAAMVGMAFQVQCVGQSGQHFGLAGAGIPAQNHEIALRHRLLGGVDQETAQRLVATHHPRILDARLGFQPLLDDLRAQAAAETVQIALRVGPGERGPGPETFLLHRPADQPVAQLDGRLLAVLLVAGAHLLALDVIHQRQVHRGGEGALAKFDRRPGVHQGQILEEDVPVVTAVGAHQTTWTAYCRRSVSSPMGDRLRPSSAATARNSSSPSGATATSRPPKVCGSHSSSLCASLSGAARWP